MKFLEGFAGYGGFRKAFEKAGWKFSKVWFSEIDKHAIANYRYNYPDAELVGSITDVPDIGKLDLFTFGWPCQDNSVAGKRKGQRADTRSGLLFHAVKCIKRFSPRRFLAENVEGLRTVNKGIDIIESLKVLAFLNEDLPQYNIEMQLLNTRSFLPHNRERLFFVGSLIGDESSGQEIFPIGETTGIHKAEHKQDIFVNCLDSSYHKGWLDHGQRTHIICDSGQGRKLELRDDSAPLRSNTGAGHGNYVIHSLQRRTGKGSGGKGHLSKLDDASYCIDTINSQAIEIDGIIRRLTPVECERLQGLPDDWTKYGNYSGIIKEISDTQRYRLTGNGVSIPPVKEIAERLLKTL